MTLEDLLKSTLEKIKNHRTLYEQNEQAVMDQMIGPIIKDLGGDPENPGLVRPEISIAEGSPDYTIMKDGKQVLIIEAKKLGVDIVENQ